MLDDFLMRAFLAGTALAAAAGPLGAFVVWQRMAYVGEAIANASLLGVVMGVLLGVDLLLGAMAFCLLLAASLAGLERQRLIPRDTQLSILAHGALALGLLGLSLMEQVRVDLMSYLLGDILAVSKADLLIILTAAALVLAITAWFWRKLLSVAVDPDLAAVEGVPVAAMRLLLTLLLAVVIALGMRIAGVLLVVSLLVIPAAAARQLTRGPEQMALAAGAVGVMAVACGLGLSLQVDVPPGPAIVATAVLACALATLARAASGGRGSLPLS